jgi:hypothetical protein
MGQSSRVPAAVVALAALVLLPACHSPANPKNAASPKNATSAPSAAGSADAAGAAPTVWPGDEQLRPGPPTSIESLHYRFTVRSLGAGTTPQLGPSQSAPPGTTYPFVVLMVHNDQGDRSAPLMDELKWRLAVQRPKVDWDGCEDLGSKRCGQYVRCIALTAPGGPARWLSAATDVSDTAKQNNSMAAGSTWRLTCYPSDPDGKTFYVAKQSVLPTDVSLLRMTDDIPPTVEKEFAPAA